MAGDSIEAAKRALHAILAMLEPRDRFSLSRFGSSVQHFHKALQPVSDKTIGDAGRKVMSVEADMGGTELAAALSSTLELGDGTRADILLITDGEVWQAAAVVAAAQSSGQRIFVVGIGSAPAESVLRRLGDETGGACEFVAPNEDVEGAITRMFLRIAQEPASQVRVSWPGAVEWEVPPGQAIFDGETLHVFARTATMPSGTARLSFVLPDGKAVEATADLGRPESAMVDLPRLAASKRLSVVEDPEQRAIAVRYQLVTEHTNCVLVHERAEVEKAKDLPELARVSQMLAKGWGGVGVGESACFSIRARADHVASYEEFEQPSAFRSCKDGSSLAFKSLSREHRNQKSEHSRSPRGFLGELSRGGGWLSLLADRMPVSIEDLENAGVPEDILDELRFLVAEGFAEKAVVGAFLASLAALAAECGCSRQFVRRLRNRLPKNHEAITLQQRVSQFLSGATADAWAAA